MDVRSLSLKIDVSAPDLKKVYAEWIGEINKVDSATQKVGKTGSSFERMNKELSTAKSSVDNLNKGLVVTRQLTAEINKNLAQTRAYMADVARQSKAVASGMERAGKGLSGSFSGVASTLPNIKNDLNTVNKTTEQLGRQTTPDLRRAYAGWMAQIQGVGKATEELGRNTSYDKINRNLERTRSMSLGLKRDFTDLKGQLGLLGNTAGETFSRFIGNLEGIRRRISDLILSTAKWGAIIASAFAAFAFGYLIREGLRFNQVLETSRIGIAAVVAATQEVSDAQGNTLTGQEKFNASLLLSRDIQQQLQVMNLQTAATYEQLLITAQAVIPAAAAQGIELDKSLQLTQALVQATGGIGLEMKQAVSESRSLLEGSINPMTDQLANALGIRAKDVKLWQQQGTLADELLRKLEDFVRAGELTQQSFAGITSNLKDAVGITTGAAFQGTFDEIKRLGQEMINNMVTFKDETFEVNPALLEVGRIIDKEIVYWLREAENAAKDFADSFDAGEFKKDLDDIKLGLADFLDQVDGVVQFVRGDTDFAAYGIIGYLLFGPVGAIAGVLAGLYDDFKKFQGEMDKAVQVSAVQAASVVEKNNARIKELQAEIVEGMKEIQKIEEEGFRGAKNFRLDELKSDIAVAKAELGKLYKENQRVVDRAYENIESTIDLMTNEIGEGEKKLREIAKELTDPSTTADRKRELFDQYKQEEGFLLGLKQGRIELQGLLDTYRMTEAEVTDEVDAQKGYAGEMADRLRDSVTSSAEIEAYLKLVDKYLSGMATNSFTFASGMFSALGASAQLEDIMNRLNKATGGTYTVKPRIKAGGDEDEKGAKRKANERKRIEEQLTNEIKKLTLDREGYERYQIEQTIKKAREAGANKVLIAQYQAAKELEIERQKYEEFQKLLDERTAEQIKRNQEVADSFAKIQFDNLPASSQLVQQLQAELEEIKKFADLYPQFIAEAEQERLRTIQRYAPLVAEARQEEYIQSLKDAGGFYNNLKAGFLEFVQSVESDSELLSEFFADTLSSMSQNFSDLFYNALTGKFEDLVDVAKSAFQAILRAFLDMVSAIATRQIIVNIAGSLGIGKGASASEGLGSKALNLTGDIFSGGGFLGGIFGGGGGGAAGIVGSATGVTGTGVGGGFTGGLAASALSEGGSGFLASIGSAIPYIGAALAAAAIIIPLISGLFKKTPRIDIDFDSVKTDMGRRAAVVNEFLDPDFFKDNIGQVSVKRKAGLGVGGDEKILELIQQRILETIEGIQDIIAKLPTELFQQLNETLLNAEIDIDTVIGGERLLEFDAKGKKIGEKFQAFIEGELPAKFFAAIRESFFDPAFQALGVSAEGAQDLIDQFLADLEAAGSREERAAIGQEFLATFNAFVDAFNIVSGNANDAIGQTIQQINQLSNKLGFDAVPSLEDLRAELSRLIENAELDPETVQAYADLRNAIVSATSAIFQSIGSIISQLQTLNATIVGFGGAAIDLSGFLAQGAADIQNFLEANKGELSLAEQESFLGQLMGIADAMLQEEMAAFQQQVAAEQEILDAQREAAQQRVEGLQNEKKRIEEAYDTRIDALNEELQIAEQFKSLTESILQTLDSIVLSTESVLTPIEQVALLQGRITSLQADLQGASDEELLNLVPQLEDAFKNLFDAAGNAFGVNSPEFVSIFSQVTGGLEALSDLTATRGRSVEEINAEIERLTAEQTSAIQAMDARIDAAQAHLADLNQQTVDNTFVASQELQDLYEYIRSEYVRILEEQFARLGEVSEEGFSTELEGLGAIAGVLDENLVTLKDQTGYIEQQLMQLELNTELLETIANYVGGAPGFAGGSGGLKDFGDRSLAFLHGQEAVLTKAQYLSIMGSMEAAISLQRNFGNVLQSFTGAMSGIGTLNKFANEIQGGTNLSNLTQKLTKGGYISSLAGELPRTPEQVVRERTAELAKENEGPFRIELTINSNNPGVVQVAAEKVAEEVEKRLVKKLDPAAKTMREAVQNRARKANR